MRRLSAVTMVALMPPAYSSARNAAVPVTCWLSWRCGGKDDRPCCSNGAGSVDGVAPHPSQLQIDGGGSRTQAEHLNFVNV